MADEIGGILTGISNLGNFGLGIANTVMNAQRAYDETKYQRELQGEFFTREDNATQRRVKDLKLAGLNPVLAAGSAANAGPVVQTGNTQVSMPQMGDLGKIPEAALALMQMEKNISKTAAETDLAKSNINLAGLKAYREAQEARLAGEKADTEKHNRQLAEDSGQTTNPGGLGKTITTVKGVQHKIAKKVIDHERTRQEANEAMTKEFKGADLNKKQEERLKNIRRMQGK